MGNLQQRVNVHAAVFGILKSRDNALGLPDQFSKFCLIYIFFFAQRLYLVRNASFNMAL